MAWDPIGDDEYSGDLPLDAFGAGLAAATEAFRAAAGRLPYASELAEALLQALAAAPADALDGRERAASLLARWIALPRSGRAARPSAKAGDILRVPYAGDGARHIYARVLFAPEKGAGGRAGPGLGHCLVVHDLDAPAEGDLPPEQVRAAPVLLGPFHVGDDEVREGRWRVVDRVPSDDAELPTFAYTVGDGRGGWREIVRDYFGDELPDVPENRARVVRQAVGPPSNVVCVVRMLRGCVRWLPSFGESLNVRREP